MENNSPISNCSDEEFESMIIKELHQLIVVVSIKYPKEDFEKMAKLFLGFDDDELNYYEHFFKLSMDVFVDFCEKNLKQK